MTERPILPLPSRREAASRLKGSPSYTPRPRAAPGGAARQSERFADAVRRLDEAFQGDDPAVRLRSDPMGIAPERALVLVAAAPISDLIRVAREAEMEILAEVDLEDPDALPGDMAIENADAADPTLYVTMPSEAALRTLLRLWRSYERGDRLPQGQTPWKNLFDLLAELRPWGPQDRLTDWARRIISERLPLNDDDEAKLELEIWPTRTPAQRARWRREAEVRVEAFGGRVISRATIDEEGSTFVYDALLVGMPAGAVRAMLESPSAPEGLATLEGVQFVLPQTIGQSIPSEDDVERAGVDPVSLGGTTAFDTTLPLRAVLLDAVPIAAHADLADGVVIEDVHDLESRSLVTQRRHATSMASLILRGDLESDGTPVADSRLLSIPVLIDDPDGTAISPNDRLFVDVIHTALVRAFEGTDPLAPDAFVVNLSLGVLNGQFDGRLSALARLLDWWAARAGVLFVVSAGNVAEPLLVAGTGATAFEAAGTAERRALIENAWQNARHRRTLLAPSEAMNVLTVGAASLDAVGSAPGTVSSGTLRVHEDADVVPAISSGAGPGAFRTIKPDILMAGGRHNVRSHPAGADLSLRVVRPDRSAGLWVATPGTPAASPGGRRRERGTSCAAALTTRAVLQAAATLTSPDGPYEGRELPRRDMALLTRALAVHGARWPDTAIARQAQLKRSGIEHGPACKEVLAGYGYGLLDEERMREAPISGCTLVALGSVRRDGARLFDVPLPPSLSADRTARSLIVTLAWFSPADAARARYRLAKLEAVAGEDDDDQDPGWKLKMKGGPPPWDSIGKGTVWSRRLIHKTVTAPAFANGATIPLRVQCRDGAGGGLSPDEDIPFAVAVTLELPVTARYDVLDEIRELVRTRLRGA